MLRILQMHKNYIKTEENAIFAYFISKTTPRKYTCQKKRLSKQKLALIEKAGIPMSIIKTKTKSSATYKGLLKRFLVEQLNIMEELGFINERSFEERQRDFENIKEKVSQILN